MNVEKQIGSESKITHPQISIIIPIYNTEEYIKECLDSVLNQSFKSIEILCIDDKTPDKSMDIVREYAKNDNRIRILENEENSGLSITRNRGIDLAKGEYIYFLDSDDKMGYESLRKLYDFAKEYDFDFVTTNAIRFNEKKKWASVLHWIAFDKETLINADILEHPKLIYDTSAWNKLFKSSFLKENNFRFEPKRLYEDLLFTLQVYCSDAKIGVCPKIYHHWRVRTGDNKSITQRYHDETNVIDRIYINRKQIELLRDKKYSKLLDELYMKLLKIDFLQFINEIDDLNDNYTKTLREHMDPILMQIPKKYFEEIDDISKLKYKLYLSNDDNLILLHSYLKDEYVRVKNLNEQIDSKNIELNEMNEKINSLKEENENLIKNKDELQRNLNMSNKENEKIRKESEKLDGRNKELIERNQKFINENKRFKKINKKQKNEIKRIKSTKGWFKYKTRNIYSRTIKKIK